jgi:amino acid transporter
VAVNYRPERAFGQEARAFSKIKRLLQPRYRVSYIDTGALVSHFSATMPLNPTALTNSGVEGVAETISAPPTPGQRPPLKRVIGLGGLAFSCFNSILGSGIFAMPALAAALLGPAALIAYLVCAVLIGLMALCFAEIGSRVTAPGGIYGYARVSLGPVMGGVAGTLLWSVNCVFPGAAIANFLTDTLAMSWPVLDKTAPRVLFLAAVYGLLALANIRATRWGARLSVATAIIKLTPLAVLVVAGVFAIHPQNLHWTGVPAWGAIGKGCVLLFFVFMGVEGGLTASGEVKDPARTVPRAVGIAFVLICSLYIGLQLVAQGVLGPDLASAKAPLADAATVAFGPWGGRLLIAAALLSALGYLTGDMLCSPRSLYALAEAGQLPRQLAVVHPRFGTPVVAVVVYCSLCFVAAISSSFRQLVIVSSSGTLLLYLICCIGLLRLRARNVAMEGEPFRAPGGPLVPLVASAIMIWMLTTLEWKELVAAAGLVVAAGAIYWVWERRRRPGGARAPAN